MGKKRTRVPPTKATTYAMHDPALSYEEQDPNGKVRKFFMEHLYGPRRMRRSARRHHPFYTKSHHKGREWAILKYK